MHLFAEILDFSVLLLNLGSSLITLLPGLAAPDAVTENFLAGGHITLKDLIQRDAFCA